MDQPYSLLLTGQGTLLTRTGVFYQGMLDASLPAQRGLLNALDGTTLSGDVRSTQDCIACQMDSTGLLLGRQTSIAGNFADFQPHGRCTERVEPRKGG